MSAEPINSLNNSEMALDGAFAVVEKISDAILSPEKLLYQSELVDPSKW